MSTTYIGGINMAGKSSDGWVRIIDVHPHDAFYYSHVQVQGLVIRGSQLKVWGPNGGGLVGWSWSSDVEDDAGNIWAFHAIKVEPVEEVDSGLLK